MKIESSMLAVLLLTASLQPPLPSLSRSLEGSVQNDSSAEKNSFGVMLRMIEPFHGAPARLFIKNVLKRSKAEQVGLRTNDEILAINDTKVADLSPQEIGKQLRGAPGTRLTLSIRRHDEQLTVSFTRGSLSSMPPDEFARKLSKEHEEMQRRRRLADALAELGNPASQQKALAQVTPALKAQDQLEVASRIEAIQAAIKEDDYASAARTARTLVEHTGAFVEGRFLYALLLDKGKHFIDAEEQLQQVIAARPDWTDALLAHADCEEKLGNLQKALQDLRQCAALHLDDNDQEFVRAKIIYLQEEIAKSAPQ